MAQASGRTKRDELTMPELFRMFPDDEAAEQWFIERRWPHGRFCPDCGSTDTAEIPNRRPMPYRCRACRRHFSVRKGTVMESSKLGLQIWVFAIYRMTTSPKGTSSMQLHRELGIRQATAWHLMQRIREGFVGDSGSMSGPAEVDETYVGGKERNKHKSKRLRAGRGPVGKTAVVGVRDRGTKQVAARVVRRTDAPTLQGFVRENVAPGAVVYTDEARAYRGLVDYRHSAVKHSRGEYVRRQAHTNGVESFWSLFKRGYVGTYHRISAKHLHRYVAEFVGRQNIRHLGTLSRMARVAAGMVGKRLPYRDLVA